MNPPASSSKSATRSKANRLAETIANETSGFFLRVVSTINEALVIVDALRPGAPIMFANEAFTRLTGYAEADAFGRKLLFAVPAGKNSQAITQVETALTEPRECRVTVETSCKNGTTFWNELSVTPVRDLQNQVTHFIAIHRDVSARRLAEERFQYLMNHDSLTRLANRALFSTKLDAFVRTNAGQSRGALLYFDLDNFKLVNDSLGHLAGDRVLTLFAGILRDVMGDDDHSARYGGDEFVMLLSTANLTQATEVGETIRAAFQKCQFEFAEQSFDLCLCVGVATFDGKLGAEELLNQADLACCAAKKEGKDRVEIYRAEHQEITRLRDTAKWSHRLKEAIRKDQFELWFQPIAALPERTIAYYEVLMRLRDAEGELILPGNFLPVAERLQIAQQIDRLMIKNALPYLAADPDLKLSINLSGQSFDDPDDLARFIVSSFKDAGVSPSRVVFEITETTALSNLKLTCTVLKRLKAAGFRFALDDFGCGFSSMTYLRELPVDLVKIDGSFIQNLKREPINEILVRSMKETARLLGLKTVAEFVEDEETLELLKYIGVDYAQGNLLGKPQPLAKAS